MSEYGDIVSGRAEKPARRPERPTDSLPAQLFEREANTPAPAADEKGNAPVSGQGKTSLVATALRWIASAVILYVVLSRMHLSGLLGVVRSADVGLVALVLCLSVLNQFCSAAKLSLILSPLAMTFANVIRLTFISTFFNAVLPSGSGDVVRVLYINKKAGSVVVSASAVVIDRLISISTQILIILSSLVFFSGAGLPHAARMIAGFILIAVAGVIVFFLAHPSGAFAAIRTRLPCQRFWKGKTGRFLLTVLARRFSLFSIICLNMAYNCIVICMVMMLTAAFSGHVRFFEAAIVVFCGSIGTFLPISVGGLGVVEAIYATLFKLLDNHKETGLAVSLGLRVALLLPVCIGFFLFALRGKKNRPSAPAEDPEAP
jgi:uncharacterized protein (TIRG00374 family)